jgi:L-malate glycosyltransferase
MSTLTLTDKRHTICHVLHTMRIGGAEVLAKEYAQHTHQDFDVVFACLDDLGELGEGLRQDGYTVEVIRRKSGFDLGCAKRLAKFLCQQQVSLVHAHQYAPFFYSALSRIGRHRIPILFMEHGRDFPDYSRPKRKLANKVLLRKSDQAVAVGECVRQALINNEGIPSSRIKVVYNGIDLSRYDAERRARESIRNELGIGRDAIVLIQVARLNRLKDHPTALQALARLVTTQPWVHLLVAGDGEGRADIERLIDELQLGSRVTLLGTRNDVPRLLQAADIFLLSSITEGVALTLIEAMATGLPCVATRVGGNAEVVIHGETGFLCDPSNPEALALRLNTLCTDHELRRHLGMAGHRRAIEGFDDRQMHAALDRIYREMLGITPDPPHGVPLNNRRESMACTS